MRRTLALCISIALLGTVACAASNPLLGNWRLESQEVNGQPSKADPLTLRITPEGDKLRFAFSVPINDVYFVSMTYTVKPDGSDGEVKNSKGETMGSVQLTPSGQSEYKLVLKGTNRPDSNGKITISADGKTLTSEQNTVPGGPNARSMHSKQVFSHY
jgi:hypothetical protein